MIFQRLIWSGLAVALVAGTAQTGVQRWQAAPIILAAEVYENQKAQVPASEPMPSLAPVAVVTAHVHAPGNPANHAHSPAPAEVPAPSPVPVQKQEHAHDHSHDGATAWSPANGAERIGWTWVANVLHAFSMALLVFAVMGVWRYQRGGALAALPLAGLVAAAGWLSFHLWPTLGQPAQVPGMETASLQARQTWWVLAVGSAVAACALIGFAQRTWRWPVAAALLALPFVVGAPHLEGDALVGFNPEAHAALERLAQQFVWATTWVALSFWLCLGVGCGFAFQRWLQPMLMGHFGGATLEGV